LGPSSLGEGDNNKGKDNKVLKVVEEDEWKKKKEPRSAASAAQRFQRGFTHAETQTFATVWRRFVEVMHDMVTEDKVNDQSALALGLRDATEWVESLVRARTTRPHDNGEYWWGVCASRKGQR
jgi:hypothetical protein